MSLSIKADQIVQAFGAKPLPNIGRPLDPLTRHLLDELKRVQTTLSNIIQAAVVVADAEPDSPRRGMVRYCVSPWDPLGTAFQGLVVYNGSAWVAV